MGRGECSPRNLEPQKLILEAESCLSRIFAPLKIIRYMVCVLNQSCNVEAIHIKGAAYSLFKPVYKLQKLEHW